ENEHRKRGDGGAHEGQNQMPENAELPHAALSVLIFTFIWNDFFWATVLIQDDAQLPITVGVRTLNGEFRQQWHLVSAASLLAAVPPVLMFFLMQKHFIAGLTLGATKG
ncbi:MAG: hypothetical protein AAFO73_08075, partial [Pseudomonadota bacterium]